MKKLKMLTVTAAMLAVVLVPQSGAALITKIFDLNTPAAASRVQDLHGLSAKAFFAWDDANPTKLTIELSNTSSSVPSKFSNAEQILSAISFDLGLPGWGHPADPIITGGKVTLGHTGRSINFDKIPAQLGPGDEVSGEWGFGNEDGTGLLANFITATQARALAFAGVNLDGPATLNGPQGGLVTDPPLVSLNGLGAIAGSVIIDLDLSKSPGGLDFLTQNGVMAEFGSDAAALIGSDITVIPEPATLTILTLGALAFLRIKK